MNQLVKFDCIAIFDLLKTSNGSDLRLGSTSIENFVKIGLPKNYVRFTVAFTHAQ